MDNYPEKTELVIDFLKTHGYCNSLIKANQTCFNLLRSYLDEHGLVYSPPTAEAWFSSIEKTLSKHRKGMFHKALTRLAEAYEKGDIEQKHHRLISRDLSAGFRRCVNDFTESLQGELASDSIRNRQVDCNRFLFFMQTECGVADVSAINYKMLIRFPREAQVSETRKHHIMCAVGEMMQFLYESHEVGFGFTIFYHYWIFNGERYWELDNKEIDSSAHGIMNNEETISATDFIGVRNHLLELHKQSGYSVGRLNEITRFIDLLYLFLEIHGCRYNPHIGEIWMNEVCVFRDPVEQKGIRRAVMLLNQCFMQEEIHLDHVFCRKGNCFQRLPEWSQEAAFKYEQMKIYEGWKGSTLDMIRSSISRFCLFIDSLGICDYRDITVEHVKSFNLSDHHKTVEGKNAYNSRIRKFLMYLGENGYLDNPLLFLSLSTQSAPSEKLVVVLTDNEKQELNEKLNSEDSPLSLRQKAILLLGLDMGLRASDISNLKYLDINWKSSSIHLMQKKTSVEVTIPMPERVRNALYLYITQERQPSDSPYVFLISRAPYCHATKSMCIRSLDAALPERNVEGSGFHVTRKTFATNLLNQGVGVDMVANALGQRGTDNVHHYLSLDEKHLRMCAISLEDMGIGGWSYA